MNDKIFIRKLKKSAPTILSIVAAGGMIGTVISAIKATPKAIRLLEEGKTNADLQELSTWETIKIALPAYVPTILAGVGTLACIFGANILNQRYQASLISAYGVLAETYKKYQMKLIEHHGEEAHKKIMAEMIEEAKDTYICAPGFVNSISNDLGNGGEKLLFYDSFSKRYFEATAVQVLMAEYHLNRNFCLGAIPPVNMFYDFLGLEPTEIGESIGWSNSDGSYYWIDFIHEKVVTDDGLECWIIDTYFPPTEDYLEDL